jgi:hypothetical protein
VNIKIQRTVMLPIIWYRCETWSLTLRDEHRLRMFENRVLRRIFGPKRDEVTGKKRKLHNEELHNLHSTPNSIRMMKSVGIATGYKLDGPGSNAVGSRFVSSPQCPDRLWGPPSLLSNGHRGRFPPG